MRINGPGLSCCGYSLSGHTQDFHRVGVAGHALEIALGNDHEFPRRYVLHAHQCFENLRVDALGICMHGVKGHRVHAALQGNPAQRGGLASQRVDRNVRTDA